MIVKVRAKDGPNLTIPIPTSLLCNRLTAGFSEPPGSISESTPIGLWSRSKVPKGTMFM